MGARVVAQLFYNFIYYITLEIANVRAWIYTAMQINNYKLACP